MITVNNIYGIGYKPAHRSPHFLIITILEERQILIYFMVEETEANNLNDVAKITQLYVARVGVQNKVFCLLILICSL